MRSANGSIPPVGHSIVATIRASEFVKRGSVSLEGVSSCRFSRLVDFAQEIAAISAEARPIQNSNTFSASLGLGGGPEDCQAIQCRLRRIDEASRFAAVFGDGVFFRNYFASWRDHPERLQDDNLSRTLFADNLQVFLSAERILKAGLLIPYTPPPKLCPGCLANASYGPDASRRLADASRQLFKRFRTETSLWAEYSDNTFSIGCEVPKGLLEHGYIKATALPPDQLLAGHPRFLAKILRGGRHKLSVKLRKAFPFDRELASNILEAVYFQLAASHLLGSPLLTNSALHGEFLSKLARSEEIERINAATGQHLTAAIPFLSQISLKALIGMRQSEPESFSMFRAAIQKAALEVQGNTKTFNAAHAKQLYSDVVEPELARLEKMVSSTRRDAINSSLKGSAILVFALTFGLYFGVIPTEFAEAAKIFGVGKATLDLASRASDALDPARSITKERFYYLWRLKRASRS